MITDRLRSAWNAFASNEKTQYTTDFNLGAVSYSGRPPDRSSSRWVSDRSFLASILNKMSMDVSEATIRHISLDKSGRYKDEVASDLNSCLTLTPNLDQTPRSFRQDIATVMFEEGVAVIVPVDTSQSPTSNLEFDIQSLRVGKVTAWYPGHVRVSLYDERVGSRKDITLDKRFVAVVQNPLFSVMNEPNSTLQRLIHKLSLLDSVDELTSSGKLDMIIQLPYVIKTEAKRAEAEKRRKDIELQLRGSNYGIAYTDGTERIVQLNRPVENTLLPQVQYLTRHLYDQLGLTEGVMNGSASEGEMANYYARTIQPVLDAIVESMTKAFIGPSAVGRMERIAYFKDPFKLVTVSGIAQAADVFTRNEIMTTNEIRGVLWMKPSDAPQANSLDNPNMPERNR